jgi:Helicase conserved C-terminal domain
VELEQDERQLYDELLQHYQASIAKKVGQVGVERGVGLNLTGADYVFILDPWWNPAAEAQAIDRAHRIGQTRNVIAYRLLAKGTVEERVAHLQAQKRDLVAGIMGDDQALAGRLTRGDLEALLSLTTVATPTASAPTG